MRYQVAQALFVVQFGFASDRARGRTINTFRLPMLHDDEMPEKFNFNRLEVIEHHKVHDEYSNRQNPPEHDGFVLKDDSGNVFANQYPTASFGQFSDTSNRRFRRYCKNDGDLSVILADPSIVYEYHLLTDVLEDIQRGIMGLEKLDLTHPYYNESRNKVKLLGFFYARLVQEFQLAYPGYGVDFKWIKYFSFSDVLLPQATVYRKVTAKEADTMSGDQVMKAIQDDGAFKVEYPNGMVLGIEHTRDCWEVFGEKHDMNVWRIYYAPQQHASENEAPQALYPIEYFHGDDKISAAFAYVTRLRSAHPGKETGNGATLAELASRTRREEVLGMSEKFALKRLLEESQIKTFDEYGAEFNLTKKNDDPFALVWAESSILNADETQRNIKAVFFPPEVTPQVAVRVFKMFLSMPGYPLGGIDGDLLVTVVKDAEREIAAEECTARANAVTMEEVSAALKKDGCYIYSYATGQVLALEQMPLSNPPIADEVATCIIFKDKIIDNDQKVHTLVVPTMASDLVIQCYLKVLKNNKPFSFATDEQFLTVIRDTINEKLAWMARNKSVDATS
jgi:hypothetical protein